MSVSIRQVLLLFCFLFGSLFAQVNTEALRKATLDAGIHPMLQMDIGYQSGNSEYLLLKGELRVDYLKNKSNLFLIANYQRGTQGSEAFLNRGFLHLRGMHHLQPFFSPEIFIQREFNDFTNLSERNLIGSGLRIRTFKWTSVPDSSKKILLFIGIGGMWEQELISGPDPDENQFRSTNYLSFYMQVNDGIQLKSICYFQISSSDAKDYRVLADNSLEFRFIQNLTFRTSLNLRYDHEPPLGIKKHDLEISNGFKWWF